jgi:hypothetical protein
LDRSHRLHPQARQCDRALLDPAGEAATVRPLWPPRGALLLFDDPAVVQARRKVRALPAPRCVSTFVVDSRHFAGSLWAPGHGTRMQDDPFRLLGRPRLLNVAVGFLGAGTRLSGPAQERYNAAPWPAGSFTPTLSGASR